MSMMRLSEAARAISAELRGEDRVFEAVSTDTRALAPQALFVALKGDRFDGHDFLAQAAEQRAAGALVQKSGLRIEDRGLSRTGFAQDRRKHLLHSRLAVAPRQGDERY